MAKKINKIEDLQPNPKNHNKGTERGGYSVEESIRRLGAGRSGLIDKNGVVLAGNHTLEKMVELDIPIKVVETDGNEWVVVQRTDLDVTQDPKATELAYADNRTAQLNFELDLEQVKLDLGEGIDLSFLWTEEELAAALGEVLEKEENDEESDTEKGDAKEIQIRADLDPGSVWQVGKHFLGCGDSLDRDFIEEVLQGEIPNLIFADPPYGIKAASSYATGRKVKGLGGGVKRSTFKDIAGDDNTDAAVTAYAILSDMYGSAVHVWWGANYYAHALPASSCWLVWDKEQTSQFADAELAWTNQKSAVRIFRHQWNGMLKASERGEERINPCQKPVALGRWCFEQYGNNGDIVLDPFCGSGISILAGDECDRIVYGIEIDQQQCERTLSRLEKKLGVVAERINW